MTFMPILGRELRLRARSRANSWGRVGIGLVAVLVVLPPLLSSWPGTSPAVTARGVSYGLAGIAFLLCCLACLLTADSISGERREGTLGLLFLTGVNRFDVLLGKFASTGLACLWSLVGLLPVFLIPVLGGGLTSAEVVREGLVLMALLFLALSAGLCAFARGYERSGTARAALLTVAAVVVVPLVLSLILPRIGLELASPLKAMTLAADPAYLLAPGRFWLSLGLALAFGVSLLVGAAASVRSHLDGAPSLPSPPPLTPRNRERSDPDFPAPGDARADADVPLPAEAQAETDGWPDAAGQAGSVGESPPVEWEIFCWRIHGPARRVGESPPIEWRLSRQRGLGTILWCAALAYVVVFLLIPVMAPAMRFRGPFPTFGVIWSVIIWSVTLASVCISGALLAWAASRFFVEARRTNELELLLTTPAGAETLVESQWRVLKQRLL